MFMNKILKTIILLIVIVVILIITIIIIKFSGITDNIESNKLIKDTNTYLQAVSDKCENNDIYYDDEDTYILSYNINELRNTNDNNKGYIAISCTNNNLNKYYLFIHNNSKMLYGITIDNISNSNLLINYVKDYDSSLFNDIKDNNFVCKIINGTNCAE